MTIAYKKLEKSTVSLSATDAAILEFLSLDARMPTAEIARRVGLARTTVQTKINRFVDTGVIGGFSVIAGSALRQREVRAMVLLRTTPGARESFQKACLKATGVRSVSATCGVYCFVIQVCALSLDALNSRIDAISTITGVERSETHILLSETAGADQGQPVGVSPAACDRAEA